LQLQTPYGGESSCGGMAIAATGIYLLTTNILFRTCLGASVSFFTLLKPAANKILIN
jgi:hypothetical protein